MRISSVKRYGATTRISGRMSGIRKPEETGYQHTAIIIVDETFYLLIA